MPRSLYVPIPEDARRALLDLAERQYRHPKDQARLLIEDGLRRAGMLPSAPAAEYSLETATEQTRG
jgi:hypothetical protein